MAVGVRGAPGHCCLSHVAPGATQTPQLALQQTCPVLQVLRPHIEIVFCEITATALCMASSQKVGAEPATPPVDAAPALSPVEAAAASAIVGAPALALAPARPATGPAGDCSFGNALGLVPELPEPLGCGRVSVSLDTGLPGVTTMPIGAACSGAISPTSPIAAGAFITNPRLRAKPTTDGEQHDAANQARNHDQKAPLGPATRRFRTLLDFHANGAMHAPFQRLTPG